MSILLNAAVAVLATATVLSNRSRVTLAQLLRYFTTLSNLFCAFTCLLVALFRTFGSAPYAVLCLKHAGTAAVTVTLLTVLLYLGPSIGSYKPLLTGPDLFLHLICPLLALVSYFGWDKTPMPFAMALLGNLPVLLYGSVYLYKVVLAPEGSRWEDFYGFNKDNRWRITFPAMVLGGLLVSILLWAI